ncbi:MAG: hypothetical protein SNH94_06940, partial [Rikenellaceae bacterium]
MKHLLPIALLMLMVCCATENATINFSEDTEEDTIEHTPDFWDANFKLTYNFTLSQSLRTQLHVDVNN